MAAPQLAELESPAAVEVAVSAGDALSSERISHALRASGIDVAPEATAASVVIVRVDVTAASSAPKLRDIRCALNGTPLVVVSPALSAIGVRRVLDAGADGLVLETDLEQALGATVLAVCAGQVVVPREAGPQLQKPALTAREKQVLGMVTLGFSNGEIARKLYLAESTVKSHLSSAFAKLGVRSRSEATALILDPNGALGPGILTIAQPAGASTDGT